MLEQKRTFRMWYQRWREYLKGTQIPAVKLHIDEELGVIYIKLMLVRTHYLCICYCAAPCRRRWQTQIKPMLPTLIITAGLQLVIIYTPLFNAIFKAQPLTFNEINDNNSDGFVHYILDT